MPVLTMPEIQNDLRPFIRSVPNFPKPGINFRDITPLLADSERLACAICEMAKPFREKNVNLVVGAESRGFIFGTSMAVNLNAGFIPIRKKGKLPTKVLSQDYELEYGTDQLEIHADAIAPGQRVLIADDLLATGGTMRACCDLVERLGGQVVGISFLIELSFLNGREQLSDYEIFSLLKYDSEH
jgi:adenine phosphoribosyltransferase